MHPINPKNFGSNGIAVSYYNGSAVVNGYIVKQIGSNKFKVTDGSHPATVQLAPTTAIATALASNPTYCTILAYPPSTTASGAAYVVNYGVTAATIVSSPFNFNVGDTLALPSGAGSLTVATLNGTEIATATVGTAGSYTSFGNPIIAHRAAGSGATFAAHYGVDSAVIVGGGAGSTAGYVAGNVLTLTGTGSATITVNTVDGGGGILTFTVSAVGTVTSLPSNPVATTGGGGTVATFTLKYHVLSVTSSGGTGYNVGDTLIFNGIVGTTTPTATITTATSHAATTVTLNTAGTGITVAATSITTSTTLATFNLGYDVLSITGSGGTGYAANDELSFNGMIATTLPTAHIATVSSGAVSTVTVDTAGTNITTAASSIVTDGPAQYVSHIYYNRIVTTLDVSYDWTLNTPYENSVVLARY